MFRRPFFFLYAAMAIALGFLLMPGAALAHDVTGTNAPIAPQCHAASDLDVGAGQMSGRGAWICESKDWQADRAVAWLRFEASEWDDAETPRTFFSRNARFKSITFIELSTDGEIQETTRLESEARPFASGPVFRLDLPEIGPGTEALLVRIERPHSVPLLTEARLSTQEYPTNWPLIDVMLLALTIGMLLLPLVFDVSFFVVLRERFVLMHAAMVASMIVYVIFAGGLAPVFVDVPMRAMAVIAPLSWAIAIGISALFLTAFLEPEAQSSKMRRLTRVAGWWAITVPGFFALQLHVTQPIDDIGYFFAFIPVILIITAAIIEALLRGSRSARFITVAWLPIIVASCERLARGIGVYAGPSTLDQLLYVAAGIEVIVMSLAIADRFFAIRRERDAAISEAQMLEALSERDPLTGLMNRRVVTDRFAELRREGFDTVALVDLDKFKDINDHFGHQVGDKVLVACAKALAGEADGRESIAVRIGGEEFVVLLKGKNTLERAEALRCAIPTRIAQEVDGLDRLMTGSMGVVVLPRTAPQLMSFGELYARADQLLYQAKASGRNRMCFERLTVFNGPPKTRMAVEQKDAA